MKISIPPITHVSRKTQQCCNMNVRLIVIILISNTKTPHSCNYINPARIANAPNMFGSKLKKKMLLATLVVLRMKNTHWFANHT